MTMNCIVETEAGRVRGEQVGSALQFLGIPYAESPTIAGRFAAPRAHARWEGTRDAIRYGASSPQPDRGVTIIPEPVITGDNELNLNVYTPDLGAVQLPVLLWIHGGGFFGGGNAAPWYRGQSFARDGVVLVVINYRLGIEGFLELAGAPANRAVRDWVRALEWVQRNIAAFGGDPGRVTIAGQSAGAAACATLLAVPSAEGLFRQAICMSGGPDLAQTPGGVRSVAERTAKALAIPARADAFEQIDTLTLLRVQEEVQSRRRAAVGRESVVDALAGIELSWAPWVDGDVVSRDPWAAAADSSEVSVLAGATAHEFNAGWSGEEAISWGDVRDGLKAAGADEEASEEWVAARDGTPPAAAVGQALTDRTFRVPADDLVRARARAGARAWSYEFRWGSPVPAFKGQAIHCLDIPFAFDLLHETGVREVAGDNPPSGLAEGMHRAWVRFTVEGDPGWPASSPEGQSAMLFDSHSEVVASHLALERRMWDGPLRDRRARNNPPSRP